MTSKRLLSPSVIFAGTLVTLTASILLLNTQYWSAGLFLLSFLFAVYFTTQVRRSWETYQARSRSSYPSISELRNELKQLSHDISTYRFLILKPYIKRINECTGRNGKEWLIMECETRCGTKVFALLEKQKLKE